MQGHYQNDCPEGRAEDGRPRISSYFMTRGGPSGNGCCYHRRPTTHRGCHRTLLRQHLAGTMFPWHKLQRSGGLQAISTLLSTVNNAHAARHGTTLVTSMLAPLSSVDESQAGGGKVTLRATMRLMFRQSARHVKVTVTLRASPTSIHTTLSMGVRTIPFCHPQRTRPTWHRRFSLTHHSSLQCSHLPTPLMGM